MLDFFSQLLTIDQSLGIWIEAYGPWMYLILFLIIFAETGLIVLPFLPGDTLLFVAGAMGASGAIHPWGLAVLLTIAAITGNTVNYYVGKRIGKKVFSFNIRFLDNQALSKTHDFYEKHGGKSIILARFVPLVRTFAPFVAGAAEMDPKRFQFYNVTGAVLWVFSLVLGGYFFGNIPFINQHLNIIVLLGLGAAIAPLFLVAGWRILKSVLKPKSPRS